MQAYDSAGEKQQWGGDRFACTVVMKDRTEVTGRVTIDDSHDGQYVCTYAPPAFIQLECLVFHNCVVSLIWLPETCAGTISAHCCMLLV